MLLLASGQQSEARSTLAVHFTAASIAGPGIVQRADLVLQYFPGDGEAVVRSEVRLTGGAADLLEGHSRRGQVRVEAGSLVVDYAASPIAVAAADTVSLGMTTGSGVADLTWQAEIRTTADNGAQSAHVAQAVLAVVPPLGVEVLGSPDRLYAGEQAQVQLVVRNADPRGRPIEGIEWKVPSCLAGSGGEEIVRLGPLAAGAVDTLVVSVASDPVFSGPVILGGRARGAGLSDSPVPEVEVRVEPVPSLQVRAVPEPLEVDRAGSLTCVWQSPVPAMDLQAIRLELGPAFEDVEVAGASAGRAAVQAAPGGGTLVEVDSLGGMAAAESLVVSLRLRPTRPGPWLLRGSVLPADRDTFVAVGTSGSRVRAVLPASLEGVAEQPAARSRPNDLELFAESLANGLMETLGTMPLPAGQQVAIRPDGKAERSWLVEDALAGALMDRGYGVRVGAPAGVAATLSYRVAEARVVYGPPARGWRLWQARQTREAVGDVYLRLDSAAGDVLWAARARSRGGDRIAAGEAPALAAGDAVTRATVAADSRWLERGLSACIVGGLFYIFFVL